MGPIARKGQRGFVLIQILAFSIVLALITFALVNLSLTEYATVAAGDQGARAFFVADAALERAVTVLRADPNWNDASGADANVAVGNNTTWVALVDAWRAGSAGNAVNQAFPGGSPIGRYSIYIRRPTAGDMTNNIWVRTQGQVGSATRSIEALLHRMSPLDITLYVSQTLQDALLPFTITVHGMSYFHGSVSITKVTTAMLNDRAISTGDPTPYLNHVYVKGTLDMTTGTPTVGTAPQPMYGAHAGLFKLGATGDQRLSTVLPPDNLVPEIPYPNVSGYISNVIANSTSGNVLGAGNLTLLECTGVKVLGSWVWTPTYLPGLTLTSGAGVVVPHKSHPTCDAAVINPGNFMLFWDGTSSLLTLGTAHKDQPIVIPGLLVIAALTPPTVTYQGIGTVLANSQLLPGLGLDVSTAQILSSNRVTGAACGSLNPPSMPQSDLLSIVMAGSLTTAGGTTPCTQEQDVVLVAGSTPSDLLASILKAQYYGIVFAESLNLSQNYEFWQVSDIWQYLPPPMQTLFGLSTPPVVVQQWRELQN